MPRPRDGLTVDGFLDHLHSGSGERAAATRAAPVRATPAALSGSVGDLGLVDLFNSLETWQKSAVVHCEDGERTATVWVRDGQVIDAEGEYQASERLKDAALVIEEHPIALQLRYLQTLLEIGGSNSSTIIFPAPIDLITPFLERKSSSD